MCDRSNAEEIVQEMLNYLETADYSIREEMVLKVAILAEKYATDYSWYVDVILNLIRMAGDHVSEEVWYRVIQIVVNREDVQGKPLERRFTLVDFSGFRLTNNGVSFMSQDTLQKLYSKLYKLQPATKTW
jgi:hypothetical protein